MLRQKRRDWGRREGVCMREYAQAMLSELVFAYCYRHVVLVVIPILTGRCRCRAAN